MRLITRRPKKDDQVEQWTGKIVTIAIRGTDSYQLDGDVLGECTRLVAEIVPAALTVHVPAADPAGLEPSSTPTDGAPARIGAPPATTGVAAWRQRWSLRHGDYGFTPTTTMVDERPIRSLSTGRRLDLPEVVLLPGMGAPGYLAPLTREISVWTQATVLDVPGWRAGSARACPPTLTGVAVATARWLETTDREGIVLFGHSTGAQSVLATACWFRNVSPAWSSPAPTFEPLGPGRFVCFSGRSPAALRREPFGEIGVVAPSYLASGGVDFVRFLRTALDDRPEDIITQLAMPILVLTGEHDGFAPPTWPTTSPTSPPRPAPCSPGRTMRPTPIPEKPTLRCTKPSRPGPNRKTRPDSRMDLGMR